MGRPKGSKNKKIKEIKNNSTEQENISVSLYDFTEFSNKNLPKGGALCVKFKNKEFSFSADPTSNVFTLSFDLIGINNKEFNDKLFKFKLSASLMYKFLEYLQITPEHLLESKLKKIKDYLKK